MTITYKGQGQCVVKSKQVTIELGSEVAVAGRVLPGPGEYEIGGVEVEGFEDSVFLIRAEELFLLYLNRLNHSLTDRELEQVSMTDILSIPVGGKETDVPGLTVLDPDQAVKVINQIDPRIVIPMYFSSIEPFRKAEGKPLEMMKELKVTKASLPLEERQVVVLT